MIQGKVQALFELIEFLHSNIDNFKKYETTIQQFWAIHEERSKLKPNDSYKDRIAFDKITTQMKELHAEIVKNITDKIHDKIIELNLFHESRRYEIAECSNEIQHCSMGEIWELKKNFNIEDVPVIISFKSKYQQFRKETNERVYFTQILFDSLDETLYELFNFFEEPKPTESLNQETELLPPQPTNARESEISRAICECINNMDKHGWKYAFIYESDYNVFTGLLTSFFENKHYDLPKTPIRLKKACKTKFAKVLGELHREFRHENKLTSDYRYFQLIKVLSHFEKENKDDLYKALTR